MLTQCVLHWVSHCFEASREKRIVSDFIDKYEHAKKVAHRQQHHTITSRDYQLLMGIAVATARSDLADFVYRKLMLQQGAGRVTSYQLSGLLNRFSNITFFPTTGFPELASSDGKKLCPKT